MQGMLRAVNRLHRQIQSADAGQGVLHPLALGAQFLSIGQMPVGAAAARPVIGAVRLYPFR
jgi:hypothetical protein